jgi:hypothetical protein
MTDYIELQRKLAAATPGVSYTLPLSGDPSIETVLWAREYVQSRLLPGERMYRLDSTLPKSEGYLGLYWLIPDSWLQTGEIVSHRHAEVFAPSPDCQRGTGYLI